MSDEEELPIDSVSVFVDASNEGNATGENDSHRETDLSDGVTEMDSVEDLIDGSETGVSGVSDATLASHGDGESDAASESDINRYDVERYSVPDFSEEIEIGANDEGDVDSNVDDEYEYDGESDEESVVSASNSSSKSPRYPLRKESMASTHCRIGVLVRYFRKQWLLVRRQRLIMIYIRC
jgi:hypothetical protein